MSKKDILLLVKLHENQQDGRTIFITTHPPIGTTYTLRAHFVNATAGGRRKCLRIQNSLIFPRYTRNPFNQTKSFSDHSRQNRNPLNFFIIEISLKRKRHSKNNRIEIKVDNFPQKDPSTKGKIKTLKYNFFFLFIHPSMPQHWVFPFSVQTYTFPFIPSIYSDNKKRLAFSNLLSC